MNLDEEIRNALRSSVRPADAATGYQAVQARLQPAPRRRTNGLRVAVFASIAVILVAAIAIGSLEAVKHLGNDQPIVVIGDDTAGMSPGSTGRTTQTTANETPAAMFRANPEHTGVYPSGGPTVAPRLLWKFLVGGGTSLSPVVSEGVVYACGGPLYALDANTGREKWKFERGAVGGSPSPAISDGVVYVARDDGYLRGLDINTGQEKWKFQTGGEVYSSPVISGGVLYFNSADGYLYAVDIQSGEEKWKLKTGDELPFYSPTISGGVAYFAGRDAYLHALDITTGEEKWKSTTNYVIDSPAVSGGMVYFGSYAEGGDGYLYALDAQTGKENWRFRTKGGVGLSSPAVSGGVVYFGSRDGYLYALDAQTGQEKWKFYEGLGWMDGVQSSPSISGGVVYVGGGGTGDTYLHALDITSGEELWKFKAGACVISSPVISDGVLYFITTDGFLYALK